MEIFSYHVFFILVFAGFFSGLIDAIAGGGGLIGLPTLLLLGVPPVSALATNRLQMMAGELTAITRFYRAAELNFRRLLPGIIAVAIGSITGTVTVSIIQTAILNKLIPWLLLIILIYVTLSLKPKDQDVRPRMSEALFMWVFGLIIGFYNGFFGPATGTFWIIALIFFLGFHLKRAVMHAKPLNSMGNLCSLFYLAALGKIFWGFAACMSVGQVIGAILGSQLVLHGGARFIKPVYVAVVFFLTLLLFLENYGPLHIMQIN